ncbi:type II secretion system F family protein [Nonomuraea rhizosphaerae]|uniref:type II secretion system F family protein n=1 Tax=Nonomuraea rhizosphaerae TaxID=2665663 RepID=UPI0027E28DC7|nr:type II secretion system F family protein [Nonomuraea rhizosphaerae]
MLVLLSAICACTATWLWISPTTPSERLAHLLPPPPKRPTTPPTEPQSAPHAPPHQNANNSPPGPAPTPSWLDNPPTSTRDPTSSRSINDHPTNSRLASSRPINRRTIIGAATTALLTAALIGGMAGPVAAIPIALIVGTVLHRREDPAARRASAQIAADLPFAADLMAACLLAGQPVSAATEIAANAIAGPLGERLSWVSRQLRLGADPEPTWAFLARDPATGQLSRAMSRAAQTGAPVADVLTRLADDARETTRAASVAAARSVGVKAVAPLGLCFLPAFVLLGIIPIVAGLAATITIP